MIKNVSKVGLSVTIMLWIAFVLGVPFKVVAGNFDIKFIL